MSDELVEEVVEETDPVVIIEKEMTALNDQAAELRQALVRMEGGYVTLRNLRQTLLAAREGPVPTTE